MWRRDVLSRKKAKNVGLAEMFGRYGVRRGGDSCGGREVSKDAASVDFTVESLKAGGGFLKRIFYELDCKK